MRCSRCLSLLASHFSLFISLDLFSLLSSPRLCCCCDFAVCVAVLLLCVAVLLLCVLLGWLVLLVGWLVGVVVCCRCVSLWLWLKSWLWRLWCENPRVHPKRLRVYLPLLLDTQYHATHFANLLHGYPLSLVLQPTPSACHEMVLLLACVEELENIAAPSRRVLQDVH